MMNCARGLAALLASFVAAAALAQERAEPRPLPGNPAPRYPGKAESESLTGPVTFLAEVNRAGRVRSVRVLRVPEEGYGFERATQDAVMRWRFEPARRDGEAVDGLFTGVVRFQLHPKDEEAIGSVVRRAFERWTRPQELGRVERVQRIEIRGRSATPTAVLESRLAEDFADLEDRAESLSLDAIRFEGDEAWVTTTLRLPGEVAKESFRTLMVQRSKRWYALFAESTSETAKLDLEDIEKLHYDADPVPTKVPKAPNYPGGARKEMVSGQVVLAIRIELDGSTTILRAQETLPYCNAAAIENAWKWRWKPAVDDGGPVPAVGFITIDFDIFAEH